MNMTPLNDNKIKVEIIYFGRDVLYKPERECNTSGQMYMERRPKGKRLCFKKDGVVTSIPLTKKMYKNLNRFTSGIRLDKYVDKDEEEEFFTELDEATVVTEDDVYFVAGGRTAKAPKQQTTLPAVIPHKPKEKAPFVVQVFTYVPRG